MGANEKNLRFFEYGQRETDYLKSKDPALGRVIDEVGHISRAIIPDMFSALANAIVGQQISSKAQETVWGRFVDMFAPVTAENIAEIPEERLQTCGISLRKASYIKEIAMAITSGSLDLNVLHTLPDEEVCRRLSDLKGIGVWTAEMLMIFSMQRPDVMSYGDLAILRGLRMLHRHRKITPALFAKYRRRYSPYATVASLYLWQISMGTCDWLYDPAAKAKKT